MAQNDGNALRGPWLCLGGNDDTIGGRQGVRCQHAKAGRRVNKDIVVAWLQELHQIGQIQLTAERACLQRVRCQFECHARRNDVKHGRGMAAPARKVWYGLDDLAKARISVAQLVIKQRRDGCAAFKG